MASCQECKVSIIIRRGIEGRVLIADFLNVEETTAYTDIGFADIFYSVYDCCADSSCDTIIVRLPYASNCSHIRLDKIMLSKIYRQFMWSDEPTRNALLSDNEIRFEFQNLIAQSLDLFLLDLQDLIPIRLLGDFNIRLRLTLLILQWTI